MIYTSERVANITLYRLHHVIDGVPLSPLRQPVWASSLSPPQIVKKHKREYKILLQCQLKYLDVLGISNTYDIE